MSAGRSRLLVWGLAALLAAFGFLPLVAMLAHASADGLVFTGADGAFPADQFQYMAWVREHADHLLASNTLDVRPSAHVFLHPMFLLSGAGVSLGLGIELAYLLWKPVALVALLFGFGAYAARFLKRTGARVVVAALALFYAAPAIVSYLWQRVDAAGAPPELPSVGGALLPSALSWGQLPAAISVGLMPLFLLGIERLARRVEAGDGAGARGLALVSACGALVSWLHPWQGQVVLVTAVVALALARPGRRHLTLAVPLAAALAPLVYYFVLSEADSAWETAARVNEGLGVPRGWVVALALLPLIAPAVLGVRRAPRDLGGRMLLAWPVAAVAVFAVGSPSFPQHALEGVTLPLAVLAVLGLAAVGRPLRIAVAAALALLVVAGLVRTLDGVRDSVDARYQARYIEPGERDALRHLLHRGPPGPVLTSADLGALVPEQTGRQTWVGHPSWTRDYAGRARETTALFAGSLPPAQAQALVERSHTRAILVPCGVSAEALRALGGRARRFGCATVIER